MRSSRLIPEEIQNALETNRELGDIAHQAENHVSFVVLNFLVLALGYTVGLLIHRAVDADVIGSILTFCGVIIGFVITSMLFSGKSEYVERLTLEQTKKYCLKTKYMLLSQSNTLFAYIFCSVFLVVSLILIKLSFDTFAKYTIALSMAYLALGGYRTLVLPYQIYEVHAFALESIASDALDRTSKESTAASSSRKFGYKHGVSTLDNGSASNTDV
ncbi:hypothetical protein [Stutzerimonas stutzeri]|uniref:hypothetical protein n=1 Tax=Stutzerimonas stutzeri TaxID=316 RepID=UPI0015E3A778|nr:hypothetical protein [Stutzerimonas stutzeri]MBA1277228.1 hypothetical protein [Stutzerimonas stutzeri]